jgi:hypothetical protein
VELEVPGIEMYTLYERGPLSGVLSMHICPGGVTVAIFEIESHLEFAMMDKLHIESYTEFKSK